MNRDHTFRLYRQSGTPTQDARGAETGGWTKIAEGVPALVQAYRGRLERQVQGQKVQVTALLMLDPDDLPADVTIAAADIVVITKGRSVAPRYMVAEALPIGERGDTWCDEAMLADTDVDPTDG